jgi:hypothetical protein
MSEERFKTLLQAIADVQVAVQSIDTRTEAMAALLGIPPDEDDEDDGARSRPSA